MDIDETRSFGSIWKTITTANIDSVDRLRLGAGHNTNHYDECWDKRDLPGIDRVVNLTNTPWPEYKDTFNVITAFDVLEHLPPSGEEKDYLVAAMEECHRLLKKGGYLAIQCPVPNGKNHYADPTHYRGITPSTLHHFCPERAAYERSFNTSAQFEMVDTNRHDGNNQIIMKCIYND